VLRFGFGLNTQKTDETNGQIDKIVVVSFIAFCGR